MGKCSGEVYTGPSIVRNNGYEGPGYYACVRDFPGQEIYTWRRQLEFYASHEDVQYWGHHLGTLTEINSKEDFERIVK